MSDKTTARVVSEHRGAYRVQDSSGHEYLAKVTGEHMFHASSREDYPVVGDRVDITALDDEQAVIRSILPRATLMKRGRTGPGGAQVIAANIDVAFVVQSVGRDYNLNRFERYFAIARDGGVQPAIVLNKIDLLSPGELDTMLADIQHRFPDIDVIPTSAVSRDGLDALRSAIEPGKTYCFLGSSGVGKSSLINALLGNDAVRTGDIGAASGRGKHITTSRQLYTLENGGMVIDNPGMREVGMADTSQGISASFGDITALTEQCKYADCTHRHEPGCAVREAVESGKLDRAQYDNYLRLSKEAEHYEMSDLERRKKDRQFGKFIKRSQEILDKHQ